MPAIPITLPCNHYVQIEPTVHQRNDHATFSVLP
jgi:hypothetical protein